MRRAIWFIIKLAVVVAIAIWLVENPGYVTLSWQDYVIETSVAMLLLAVLALAGISTLLYRLWRSVRGAPRRFGTRRLTRKRERGYEALTRGMVAVAAGDAEAARRFAREADDLLRNPPLTLLLSAQAAQLNGDDQAAQKYFEAMLERPETAFLGIRGLLNRALRENDRETALRLARQAHDLQPRTPWVLTTLFDLEARSGQWERAERTLAEAQKLGAVASDIARQRRAALLLERSFEAELEGHMGEAETRAKAAHDLLPGFAPAAARVARLLTRAGKPRPAAKAIDRAWRIEPHPDLADTYRKIEPAADALTQVKRMERLRAIHPDHVETHIAMAEVALEARLWGEARGHLTKALAQQPTGRVYRLLAELAQGEHGDTAAARDWLAKMAVAQPDPQWICGNCGTPHQAWRSICTSCASFDSLQWREPAPAAALPEPADGRDTGQTGVLPLAGREQPAA